LDFQGQPSGSDISRADKADPANDFNADWTTEFEYDRPNRNSGLPKTRRVRIG